MRNRLSLSNIDALSYSLIAGKPNNASRDFVNVSFSTYLRTFTSLEILSGFFTWLYYILFSCRDGALNKQVVERRTYFVIAVNNVAAAAAAASLSGEATMKHVY